MFRTIQSLQNAAMAGEGQFFVKKRYEKTSVGGFLFPVRVP